MTDPNTQGNWQGTYGQDGYLLYGATGHTYSSNASYATITSSGGSNFTWDNSSSDVRELQVPGGGGSRTAGCYFSAGSLTVDVNITDGQAHWVTLHFLDFDTLGRQSWVKVYDATTGGALLDSEVVSSYGTGKYVTWGIKGHVKFVIKNAGLNNLNATVSGVFLDSGERKLSDTRYVYDGWNVISELDGKNSNAVKRTEVWGLDVSGSLQGAGGVGGLLAVNENSTLNAGTYLPCYDGNGNVTAMENAASGAVAAQYEYGPFGELVRATGAYAAHCPWRFSTKYTDSETGLIYCGYRYCQPVTGRWISRDPAREAGGQNLYGCIHNDSIDKIDILGLREIVINVVSGPDLGDSTGVPSTWRDIIENALGYIPNSVTYIYDRPLVSRRLIDQAQEQFKAENKKTGKACCNTFKFNYTYTRSAADAQSAFSSNADAYVMFAHGGPTNTGETGAYLVIANVPIAGQNQPIAAPVALSGVLGSWNNPPESVYVGVCFDQRLPQSVGKTAILRLGADVNNTNKVRVLLEGFKRLLGKFCCSAK